jgi:hypothetical protein
MAGHRKIVAAFGGAAAAEAARDMLMVDGIAAPDVSLAPGVVAEPGDGPIRRPVTFLVVRVSTDIAPVIEALRGAGGTIMADLPADRRPEAELRSVDAIEPDTSGHRVDPASTHRAGARRSRPAGTTS